jgi:hypothetical protein
VARPRPTFLLPDEEPREDCDHVPDFNGSRTRHFQKRLLAHPETGGTWDELCPRCYAITREGVTSTEVPAWRGAT